MRFLTLYTPSTPMSGPPSPEMMEKMGKLLDTEKRAGHLVTTGGLKNARLAASQSRVRTANTTWSPVRKRLGCELMATPFLRQNRAMT